MIYACRHPFMNLVYHSLYVCVYLNIYLNISIYLFYYLNTYIHTCIHAPIHTDTHTHTHTYIKNIFVVVHSYVQSKCKLYEWKQKYEQTSTNKIFSQYACIILYLYSASSIHACIHPSILTFAPLFYTRL